MKTILTWIKKRKTNTLQYDTPFWRVMTRGLWIAATMAVLVAGSANPTGLGLVVDLVIYVALHMFAFFFLTKTVAFLLSVLYLPLPRLFTSSFLYTAGIVYLILYFDKLGILLSLIVGTAYALGGVLCGLLLHFFMSKRINSKVKAILLMLPMMFYVFSLLVNPSPQPIVTSAWINEDSGIVALAGENPATLGLYKYRYFTYGSGEDKHRSEFNAGVELLSSSVDASDYIDEWPWIRRLFWGFDEDSLPLNGRVWMPEGTGPFPLVLMTHGNHSMEYFSDGGYGYLGELLASRGFIAISIDQNFLNYSLWSGTPTDDMKLRAWVFIHHLLQIEKFHNTPDTPFYQRVDLQKIALIGHSRGGQAAAMVADYRSWFAGEPSFSTMDRMGIEAVVGLAPTDKKIDGKNAILHDSYYLVLHGAQDADVNSFSGDRQYARASYEQGSDKFKASLYIGEANHSQFNSDWGSMDSLIPKALFFNQQDTMAASLQREITKTYIAAFLETALHEDEQYIPLFKDYRYGHKWLPFAHYRNRFENGMCVPLLDIDGKQNKMFFANDVTVTAEGFSHWEIEEARDRRRRVKGRAGVVLAWDEASSYSIVVSDSFRNDLRGQRPQSLLLSMANIESDVVSNSASKPIIEVEVETADTVSVRLPLAQFMPLSPRIYTQYMKLAWFTTLINNGKYSEATEAVSQTYELPLDAFTQLNPNFQPHHITKITLHFSAAPGKVMIDDIGFLTL